MNSTHETNRETPAYQPRNRNPKAVYVAMVMGETLTRETGLFWEELAEHEEASEATNGFSFTRTRVSGYGLGKCRNIATWMAQQTDCGKFVFIDSDIKPSMAMLLRLVSHDEPAVSGMYPKKLAASLEWVGNMIGNGLRPDGLTECLDFGGGFCCLDLNLVDRLCAHYHEESWFVCEDRPFKDKIMHDLWATGPVTDEWYGKIFPRFLTEDFYFCWRIRKMGVPIYLDTFCQVGHVGPVDFLQVHTQLRELEKSSIFRAPS